MITLVETARMPEYKPSYKLRRLINGGADITNDIFAGLRLLRIKLPEGDERAMARAARLTARRAAALGVGRTIYPKDFRYKAEFERIGAREPDVLPLHKELAYDMCTLAAARHGIDLYSAGAAVFANRLTRQTEKAVLNLCGKARQISLLVERGADGFINELRRDMGVSIVGRRIDSLLADTDLLLMLDKPRHMPVIKRDAAVIALYEGGELPDAKDVYTGAELLIPAALKAPWPPVCDEGAIAAALFEAGALKADNIKLKELIAARADPAHVFEVK